MNEQNKTHHTFLEDSELLTDVEKPCQLIVWNDDVTTSDWVIHTLMEICSHNFEQAEQSALIIHTKGKYPVKEGFFEHLKLMCDAITERGIGATIEALSEK